MEVWVSTHRQEKSRIDLAGAREAATESEGGEAGTEDREEMSD